jgi:hypothetical protein
VFYFKAVKREMFHKIVIGVVLEMWKINPICQKKKKVEVTLLIRKSVHVKRTKLIHKRGNLFRRMKMTIHLLGIHL